MNEAHKIAYNIQNQLELNLSYMPFVKNGGLFIPTNENYDLNSHITVQLKIPGHNDSYSLEGKVIWINPKNALYQVHPGIGIQFIGENAKSIHEIIKANIDNTLDVGGYVYGMSSEKSR